jgi:hypothetical protein
MGKILETYDAAVQVVTDDRGAAYGHPGVDFERAALLKSGVEACPHPAIQHALEMICVKMARLCHTPDHLDSVIDIAGYARTIAMIIDKEFDAAHSPLRIHSIEEVDDV